MNKLYKPIITAGTKLFFLDKLIVYCGEKPKHTSVSLFQAKTSSRFSIRNYIKVLVILRSMAFESFGIRKSLYAVQKYYSSQKFYVS